MKSVIVSAVLLVMSVFFCLFVKGHTESVVDALYAMTERLPTDPAAYEDGWENCQRKAEEIGDYWADAVAYFSYVCGYAALNRADEAIWNLYAAIKASDYPSAIIARYQLLDALRRMRKLEEISLSSVF